MAPRSTKAKKATDVKVAEAEVPKKGRGKAKTVLEEEFDLVEPDVAEKVEITTEKKAKRGKKAVNGTNGIEHTSDKSDESAPPTKKGKKNIEENNEEILSNGDNSSNEETTTDEVKQNGVAIETDAGNEESQTSATKGRKKQQKKETEAKPKDSGRGRKNTKQTETSESVGDKEETAEEKPKAKGRGRKAPTKTEIDEDDSDKTEASEEAPKVEPVATKGRKKAATKAAKEKSPINEEPEKAEEDKEQALEEPKKKEAKGKKNQGKKAPTKEESVEKDEEVKQEPAAKKRKTTKKDKAKGDAKDEESAEQETPEEKPAKAKRGKKNVNESPEEVDDEQTTKRRRKQAEEKAPTDKKKAPAKNKATTSYEELDLSNTSKDKQGREWNFKLSSWNVDGIRAWLGKGGLDYLQYEKPDILCLQEVKCSQDKLPEELVNVPGYHAYWLCSDKDGYAGVGIYTTKLAMNVQYGLKNEELDSEGRIITAEYEHFYLISTYVPNAGRKLVSLQKRLKWNEEFRKYVKELDKKKPVIICGDMNVAHNEIDLANPKTNRKNAGFTDEERSGMTDLLSDGFVDTFRHLNADSKNAYTFWTYMMNSRAKNVGWRLDYFLVSERLMPSLCDSVIRSGVYGSDHCPISLFLHLSSADKPK